MRLPCSYKHKSNTTLHVFLWLIFVCTMLYFWCLLRVSTTSLNKGVKDQEHERSSQKVHFGKQARRKAMGSRCAPRLSGSPPFVRPTHGERRLWSHRAGHSTQSQLGFKPTMECQRYLPLRRHDTQQSSSSKGLHDTRKHARPHDGIASKWYSCLLFCTHYEASS
jgi:hypothetical protein